MVTVAVAVVAPAATVTFAGTVATVVLELVSVTKAPPAGAGSFSVTVAVDGEPPVTEAGLSAIEARIGALTVRFAFFVTPSKLAETVTTVFELTGNVWTVTVAEVAPPATETWLGRLAIAALLLASEMVAPEAGAVPVRVSVRVEVRLP